MHIYSCTNELSCWIFLCWGVPCNDLTDKQIASNVSVIRGPHRYLRGVERLVAVLAGRREPRDAKSAVCSTINTSAVCSTGLLQVFIVPKHRTLSPHVPTLLTDQCFRAMHCCWVRLMINA